MTSAPPQQERPARTGVAGWWAGLGPGQRVVAVVVGAVVGVNLALAGLRAAIGSEPGGPASSSFGTGSDGLEAMADLLEREGRPVTRLRERVTPGDLPGGATVVVTDVQGLTAAEGRAVVDSLASGGRLVAAGQGAEALVQALSSRPVSWVGGEAADDLDVWVPVDEVGEARILAGDSGGRWEDTGDLLAVAGSAGEPTVLVGDVGDGRLVALADADVLHNAHLGTADNAAFALGLAGADGTPVVFVESVHGFAGGGLAAVPSSWKWAAGFLALALAAGTWAAGARFGPAEPQRRDLPPPRRDHVEAVAASIGRAGGPLGAGVEPLVGAARSALLADLGLAVDAPPADVRTAAASAGLDPRLVAVLVGPAHDLDAGTLHAAGAFAAGRQRLRYARGGTAARVGAGPAGTVGHRPRPGGSAP